MKKVKVFGTIKRVCNCCEKEAELNVFYDAGFRFLCKECFDKSYVEIEKARLNLWGESCVLE